MSFIVITVIIIVLIKKLIIQMIKQCNFSSKLFTNECAADIKRGGCNLYVKKIERKINQKRKEEALLNAGIVILKLKTNVYFLIITRYFQFMGVETLWNSTAL